MHDWLLVSITAEWLKGLVVITFNTPDLNGVNLVASKFSNLKITQNNEWGESESINEVSGPFLLENGNYFIEIEIQSGDKILLEAESIKMPEGFRQ